jgi:hypothetical protein
MIVMDDFGSGAITDWRVVGNGSGGWFVFSCGQPQPIPRRRIRTFRFDLPDPPQGKFAA